MRFVRYRDQGNAAYGVVVGEKVKEITGLPFPNVTQNTPDYSVAETARSRDLGSLQLLWPCEPSKILAVGLNYRSHLEAQKRKAPERPEIFVVPTSALL